MSTGTFAPNVEDPAYLPDPEANRREIRRFTWILAFMWVFHWSAVVYNLPLRLFLKDHLKMEALAVASVLFVTNFAWNMKPLFAWVCDTFLLFDVRRKPYIALGSAAAAIGFFALLLLPDTAANIKFSLSAANLGLVFASCALGGLMIEMGNRNGDLARQSSIRGTINTGISIVLGPLGGFLAGRWIGWSWGFGLACCILAVVLNAQIREPRVAADIEKPKNLLASQLKALFLHPNFWFAIVATILLTLAPGFGTLLLYYQTDVLKFSSQLIGNLGFVNGGLSIVAGLLCVFLSKRWTLKKLIVVFTLINALGTLVYLFYNSLGHALLIEAVGGFIGTPSTIILFLIAGYAVPKGLEAMGYSIIMALSNLTIGLSDIWGTYMGQHFRWTLHQLVWVNAGSTLLILALVPLMPATILNRKDAN